MRFSMSFYGSTPNYAFIWDEAGFEGTTARIREKQKAGDFEGMAAQITDDHIATFAIESTWDGLADALTEEVRRNRDAHRALQRARRSGALRAIRRCRATHIGRVRRRQNGETRSMLTNAPRPLASFVKRVPSNDGSTVHPLK